MEMHVGVLSQQLRKRGHHVEALCAAGSDLDRDLQNKGIKTAHFSPAGHLDIREICRCRRFLKMNHFNIMHAHYSKDLWTLVPATYFRHLPIVFIKHIGTQKPKRDPLHNWIYRRIGHTIAISAVIEKNLLETHAIPRDRLCVVHHGVDLTKYDDLEEKRAKIRHEFALSQNELLIGTIGRFQVGKGHLEFLQMAANISSRYPQTRFIMVGEPTRGEEATSKPIYDKITQIGLGKKLVLPGFRQDIPSVLAAMDIFAFPSHAEAFGLVVIEAMAAKVAVISSNCDGILDIVTHNDNGLLVPAHNSEQLTRAVEKLILDPAMRKRFADAGRRTAENKFNLENSVSQVESIYFSLVGDA
jgi:glycosyltransferase involved in cell wall biosynthesis